MNIKYLCPDCSSFKATCFSCKKKGAFFPQTTARKPKGDLEEQFQDDDDDQFFDDEALELKKHQNELGRLKQSMGIGKKTRSRVAAA